MRVGVVSFPGACDDRDAMRAVELMGAEPVGSGTPTPTWAASTP